MVVILLALNTAQAQNPVIKKDQNIQLLGYYVFTSLLTIRTLVCGVVGWELSSSNV